MEKEINRYALILAGGRGTRLWPISTTNKPKQFLNLYTDNIMINETIKIIEPLFDYKNIFVIVNKEHEEIANRYIDYNIPRENIIYEPESKNTSISIFYASIKIIQSRGDGIITILSSDHYINDEEKFIKNIEDGIKIASEDENLVTIGIKPTYPSTGFGYIKYSCDEERRYNIVKEFKEKPTYEKALEYLESGEYYWNSGIMIWNIQTILENFKIHLPEIYKYKEEIEENISNFNKLKEIYSKVKAVSISNGILEKSTNIKMVKGGFDWMDIGSINDFFKLKPKNKCDNVELGNIITHDTEKTNIYNENRKCLIATIGVKNLNIINSNDVILIANKESMSELTNMIEQIKKKGKLKKYL